MTRSWANPDGTFTTEIAAGPVRVPNPSDLSGWSPIDTTLEAAADGIRPVATAADLVFSDGGSGDMATVAVGTRSLTQVWPAPLPTPTLRGDTAIYAGVMPGIDLTLQARRPGSRAASSLPSPPSNPWCSTCRSISKA